MLGSSLGSIRLPQPAGHLYRANGIPVFYLDLKHCGEWGPCLLVTQSGQKPSHVLSEIITSARAGGPDWMQTFRVTGLEKAQTSLPGGVLEHGTSAVLWMRGNKACSGRSACKDFSVMACFPGRPVSQGF